MKITGAIVLFTAIVLMLALAGRPGPNDPPRSRSTSRGQLLLAVIGFLAGLLAFAHAAIAAPFTPELEVSYQSALVEWGAPAGPPGCSSVDRQLVPRESIEAEGRATQPAPGQLVPCVLLIAVEAPPCEQRETLRHEVGHLLGYGHSDDPASAMFAGDPSTVTYECWGEWEAGEQAVIDHQRALCRSLGPGRRRAWVLAAGPRLDPQARRRTIPSPGVPAAALDSPRVEAQAAGDAGLLPPVIAGGYSPRRVAVVVEVIERHT